MGKEKRNNVLVIVLLLSLILVLSGNFGVTGELVTKKVAGLKYPIYSGASGRSSTLEGGPQQKESCHEHVCEIEVCPPGYTVQWYNRKMTSKTGLCQGTVRCAWTNDDPYPYVQHRIKGAKFKGYTIEVDCGTKCYS